MNREEIRVYPLAEGPCWVCKRRPPEMNMRLPDGRIVGLCGTCHERREDERHT